ncbi:aminotransferase class I/II-fold pyridoxal phosphate-dependent enzyme [Rhodococcus hoagii]|nr:aminotransferase class I/II-fold pyridoxal phosphate-dependent enzyme [Prescottella equi]NKR70758.1 aminotransferase class I/II-fold pyridoxal phosphate-dependent enzyme [Prescottella equi]NKR71511.1 aminotransferase class I/II-fold pyridoxal phosphate-dependent enzyme [Prescottella equi]NKR92043.1 aminotransferase class I/II-fold pyridoxal phosphate-dependent enzyme [Prescottella equi]NKS66987.1 aminotransferase class I/II-fold pyridoxal phosphate-dependent enzyme [Prescottella equi]
MTRVVYARSVHDEREIEACLEVLRGGPFALKIGKNVAEMERKVADLYGKKLGLMCNSGSSALYLALELLDLPKGSEVITSPLTFSTDVSPIVRGGWVPVFVDVEPDTYNVDVGKIEELITDKTKAILVPNLAGNAPDWDVIREIADKHDLKVIEDSCDCIGTTLRGTKTGSRSDITVTSFAMSHIITAAGNGGMVCLDDEKLRDKGLMLRRWGRRSEPHLFGSEQARTGRVFREDLDGVAYDNDFIFDVLPWNFEPSELGSAFGLVQLSKLEVNYKRRHQIFDAFSAAFGAYPDLFRLPKPLEGFYTAWLCYPVTIREDAGFERGDLQESLEAAGIDTRTVWSGNVTRHPMMRNVEYRIPEGGLPFADEVFERGMSLGMSHGMSDEELDHVVASIHAFASKFAAAKQ